MSLINAPNTVAISVELDMRNLYLSNFYNYFSDNEPALLVS
jgi:hypothetical protein